MGVDVLIKSSVASQENRRAKVTGGETMFLHAKISQMVQGTPPGASRVEDLFMKTLCYPTLRQASGLVGSSITPSTPFRLHGEQVATQVSIVFLMLCYLPAKRIPPCLVCWPSGRFNPHFCKFSRSLFMLAKQKISICASGKRKKPLHSPQPSVPGRSGSDSFHTTQSAA